jgi:hypothetical protein
LDNVIRAVLAQRVRLMAAINADHASEAASPASFDASKCIFEQGSARRLNPKPTRGFKKKRRIGLAGQAEFLRIKPVDTGIDKTVESRSAQNGGAVLTG